MSNTIETQAVVVRESSAVAVRSACIEWFMGKNSNGYGIFNIGGRKNHRQVLAHRMIYEISRGPIPRGMLVCHRCDNPPCVNPEHLFLGTSRDNTLDAWNKGRLPQIPPMPGELNPKAKLTEEQVIEIRRLYASGVFQKTIGAMFGIKQITVSNITTRKHWKFI